VLHASFREYVRVKIAYADDPMAEYTRAGCSHQRFRLYGDMMLAIEKFFKVVRKEIAYQSR